MQPRVRTINLPLRYRLGSVNCYLIDAGTGFVLIDTGGSSKRVSLERELDSAGCLPGDLKLIVLTHGDFDHTGNAAYLRKTFGAKVAMHCDDAGMVERGDMFWNRRKGNLVLGMMARVLFGFGRSKRFKPDLVIEDGYDLSEHGFDARVLHVPGHSKGSIGVLTAGGNLFCGDLLENTEQPSLSTIIDDATAAKASVEKLRDLTIATVYPGHGRSFPITELG